SSLLLSSYSALLHQHLPSFPTRRSSDLTTSLKSEPFGPIEAGTLAMCASWDTDAATPSWKNTAGPIPCDPCLSSTLKNLYSAVRSEEHTSELQSRGHLVCRLLLEKKNKT